MRLSVAFRKREFITPSHKATASKRKIVLVLSEAVIVVYFLRYSCDLSFKALAKKESRNPGECPQESGT
jgi:hypothetical protein